MESTDALHYSFAGRKQKVELSASSSPHSPELHPLRRDTMIRNVVRDHASSMDLIIRNFTNSSLTKVKKASAPTIRYLYRSQKVSTKVQLRSGAKSVLRCPEDRSVVTDRGFSVGSKLTKKFCFVFRSPNWAGTLAGCRVRAQKVTF